MFSYMDLMEILDRAQEGPFCTEKDWNTHVIPELVQKKVKKYDIKYDCEVVIPSDNTLADSVYQAGFELAVEAGVLCTSTNRRIKFTENELKRVLRKAPSKLQLGHGRDAVTQQHRQPEDSKSIINIIGPIGTMVSQELFLPISYSYTKEDIVDVFDGPTLEFIYGRRVRVGTPLEAIAAKIDMRMAREACNRAGKPGLCIVGVESSPTYLGHISAGAPEFGLYKSDIQFAPLISELKTNWGQLNKVAHSLMMGGINMGLGYPMIGGYVGGPEGAAITIVAAAILSTATHLSHLQGGVAHDFRYQSNTGRESVWAENVGHQALARNTHILHGGMCSPAAGCCTEMVLYEGATTAIASAMSGQSGVAGVRTGRGILRNNCSSLEARFFGELTRIVPKIDLKRQEANRIVLELIQRYEKDLMSPPRGKTFPECYNISTCKPTEEWLEIYEKVRKEVEGLGIDYEYLDKT